MNTFNGKTYERTAHVHGNNKYVVRTFEKGEMVSEETLVLDDREAKRAREYVMSFSRTYVVRGGTSYPYGVSSTGYLKAHFSTDEVVIYAHDFKHGARKFTVANPFPEINEETLGYQYPNWGIPEVDKFIRAVERGELV